MKKIFYFAVIFFVLAILPCAFINAQGGVAINAGGAPPDNSALLDVSGTGKGLLMPRMSTAQRNAITNPANGLTIFNTDCNVYNYNAGTPENPNWATMAASNVLSAGLSISANPIGAICAGSSVTFTASPSQNNLSPSYQWQVNGGDVGGNSATYTTSSLNNGDVVSCILTSSTNCVTGSPATSNAITMSVNIVPTITGTTPSGFCNGNAVTLGASASLGTINWYSDSTGGSSLSSGASFTITGLTSTTTYYVDATANGCVTSSRTPVIATFYPNTPPQPGTISGPALENPDSTATYTINALSNTASYSWTVSNGTIIAGQGTTSIAVAWSISTGTGSVSVVSNNPCGTSAAQTLVVYLATQNMQTFSYTGAPVIISFPPWVTSANVTLYGAQGADGGGEGGSATGTLAVTPGETFYVYVGGAGNGSTGGFNGGGNGGYAGGGGASDIRNDTGLNSRLIVAGGGGGSTAWGSSGGAGGGTTGGAASNSNEYDYCSYTYAYGGGGGSQNSGGSAGDYTGGCCGGTSGNAGSLGLGGGSDNDNNGGGGGGYYGGGSGATPGCSGWGSGGGGGSGYIGGVTNGSMQTGVQSGNGQVVITW